MTAREKKLRKQMREKIAQTCVEIAETATIVFYLPAYNRQKANLAHPRLPLKKLIDKDEVLDIQQAIATGDGSAAVERLSAINRRLEKFENGINRKT